MLEEIGSPTESQVLLIVSSSSSSSSSLSTSTAALQPPFLFSSRLSLFLSHRSLQVVMKNSESPSSTSQTLIIITTRSNPSSIHQFSPIIATHLSSHLVASATPSPPPSLSNAFRRQHRIVSASTPSALFLNCIHLSSLLASAATLCAPILCCPQSYNCSGSVFHSALGDL